MIPGQAMDDRASDHPVESRNDKHKHIVSHYQVPMNAECEMHIPELSLLTALFLFHEMFYSQSKTNSPRRNETLRYTRHTRSLLPIGSLCCGPCLEPSLTRLISGGYPMTTISSTRLKQDLCISAPSDKQHVLVSRHCYQRRGHNA